MDGVRDETYEAIVVGSGFGGAVAACRLAQAGIKVAVLERGRRYPLGTFPRHPRDREDSASPAGWLLEPVVMTTTDSNTWGGASGHTYTLTPKPDGTTDVDVVVVRDGKNFKGRLIGAGLAVAGKRVLGKELGKTVKAIEARNDAGRATAAT